MPLSPASSEMNTITFSSLPLAFQGKMVAFEQTAKDIFLPLLKGQRYLSDFIFYIIDIKQ